MKWIRISALILCACLVSTAWGQQTTGNVRNNWSEFHRPEMQRSNPYEVTLNVQNVPNLQLNWSYATGSVVSSSPAVVNGVVYVGSEDNNVYALSATTGAKLWSFATGSYYLTIPRQCVIAACGARDKPDYHVLRRLPRGIRVGTPDYEPIFSEAPIEMWKDHCRIENRSDSP